MPFIKNDFIIKKNKNNKSYKYCKTICDICHKDIGYRANHQSTKCKICSSKLKRDQRLNFAKKFAINKGGECLSTSYIDVMSNLDWKCSCNFKWSANFNNVINNNTWCPKCADTAHNTRFSIEKAHDAAIAKEGICISKEYKSARSPLTWRCKNGHVFSNTLCNINAGSWCPKCLNKTEQKVREIFESLFNKSFPRTRPDFLKNPTTGANLELDGYCEELKLAFEYDGEWHYLNHFANDDLKIRQERDILKNKLCLEHGITLFRIPYTAKKSIKEFVLNLVKYNKYEENL